MPLQAALAQAEAFCLQVSAFSVRLDLLRIQKIYPSPIQESVAQYCLGILSNRWKHF